MDILTITKHCTLIVASLLGQTLSPDTDPQFDERVAVCELLYEESLAQNVPVDLTLAVGWQESDLTDAGTNSSGCSGPMQIKIKYWCPNEDGDWSAVRADGVLDGCDLYYHGVFALKYYLRRFNTTESALCAYGWGNCDSEGREKYVKQTLRYRSIVREVISDYSEWVAAWQHLQELLLHP
jgi:hypothetical protein